MTRLLTFLFPILLAIDGTYKKKSWYRTVDKGKAHKKTKDRTFLLWAKSSSLTCFFYSLSFRSLQAMLDACSLAPLIQRALFGGGESESIGAAFEAYRQERFLIAQDATNGSAGLGRLLSRHVSSLFLLNAGVKIHGARYLSSYLRMYVYLCT